MLYACRRETVLVLTFRPCTDDTMGGDRRTRSRDFWNSFVRLTLCLIVTVKMSVIAQLWRVGISVRVLRLCYVESIVVEEGSLVTISLLHNFVVFVELLLEL